MTVLRYRRAPAVLSRMVGREVILAPVDGDACERLSETASDVWRLLEVRRSRSELARILSASYAASPSEIERDVGALLDELVGRRLIDVTLDE